MSSLLKDWKPSILPSGEKHTIYTKYIFYNYKICQFMDRIMKALIRLTLEIFTFKMVVMLPVCVCAHTGYVHSRVEEEYLWECKQLGAFSPSVLLNTLLYFCTKFFSFKTVAQHRRLSFAHIMRCSRSHSNGSKMSCLRFYPPMHKDIKNTKSQCCA